MQFSHLFSISPGAKTHLIFLRLQWPTKVSISLDFEALRFTNHKQPMCDGSLAYSAFSQPPLPKLHQLLIVRACWDLKQHALDYRLALWVTLILLRRLLAAEVVLWR